MKRIVSCQNVGIILETGENQLAETFIQTGQNTLCVYIDVNQDDTNCNPCAQGLVIFHAQTYTNELWSHTKTRSVWLTLPVKIARRRKVDKHFKPAEPRSPWNACFMLPHSSRFATVSHSEMLVFWSRRIWSSSARQCQLKPVLRIFCLLIRPYLS